MKKAVVAGCVRDALHHVEMRQRPPAAASLSRCVRRLAQAHGWLRACFKLLDCFGLAGDIAVFSAFGEALQTVPDTAFLRKSSPCRRVF